MRTLNVVYDLTRTGYVRDFMACLMDPFLVPSCFIYTSGLASLLAGNGALGKFYADDVQAYMRCLSPNVLSRVLAMSRVLVALESWLSSNRLSLSPANTTLIWLGIRSQFARVDLTTVAAESQVLGLTLPTVVRDLCILLDQ